jgi:pimeloyl-ACP methyl ester carboxylesterase
MAGFPTSFGKADLLNDGRVIKHFQHEGFGQSWVVTHGSAPIAPACDMGAVDGPHPWLNDAIKTQYRSVWQQGLTGPLNYYRASPMRPARPGDAAAAGLHLPHSMLTVQVPTCVIWGMKDIALPPGLIDGLGEFVPKLTLHRVKNGSHWLVHEQPLRVAGLIEDFLRDDKAARPVNERTKVVRAVRAPRTQRY